MIAGSLNRLNRKGRTASGPSGPPRLNGTTASLRVGISAGCLDARDQPLHVGDRGVGQDAVAEVEDVGARAPLLEQRVDAAVERLPAGAQQHGVEGALDAEAV